MRPTKNNYLLNDISLSKMKYNLRLPKTDYDNYNESRTPVYFEGSFSYSPDTKKFTLATDINKPQHDLQIGYEISINNNQIDIDIVIGSSFRVIRDSLVAKGKLNLPYTDTEEYKEKIKNSILYWKDERWVKREELD